MYTFFHKISRTFEVQIWSFWIWNDPSARPQTVIFQPQWHAWRPAGLRSHLDQKMLIFYCKYWCLSSQPGVSSRRDESKCHQVLVFSDQNEWASCRNSPATASLGLLKIRQNPSVQALFGEQIQATTHAYTHFDASFRSSAFLSTVGQCCHSRTCALGPFHKKINAANHNYSNYSLNNNACLLV